MINYRKIINIKENSKKFLIDDILKDIGLERVI
jgi:hypothetical protein